MELEIIACSVEDAIAAHQGGASRLEVTIELAQSGLTPPLEMVLEILHRAPIPARIMVREFDDFVLRGTEELAMIKERVRTFAALPVDGLVIGYIKEGSLDLGALGEIMAVAPSARFTLHNAIERTSDPIQALREGSALPNVDRALVSGGGGPLPQRIERLRAYQQALAPGRDLIVGGGLMLDMLAGLRCESGLSIFHLGRAVRTPEEPTGRVDRTKVRKAREILGSR